MAGGVRAGQAFVEIWADGAKLAAALDKAQARLSRFSERVRDVGTQMMAVSSAILAPVALGTNAYADFEQQMANVSTVLEKPAEFMDQFNSGIKRLAVQFGESTDALAKGLYDILSASIPPEKAMGVLEASVKAAKGGMSDAATAVDAITTLLNAYGMSADKAGQVSDWMFQTVLRGKITFSELATQVGKTASLAHTAGLSLDDMGAFIATVTRNGVKSEAAMTGLNAIIKAFLKPGEGAAKAAEELGIDMSGAALRTQGLLETFHKLQGLPPDILARLFPDVDALKGLLPALNNLGAFGDDVKAMGSAAGSTEGAYKKLSVTVSTAFAKLRQAGQVAMISIGEATKTALGSGVEWATKAITKAAAWIDKNREFVQVAAVVALAIGTVGTALFAAGVAGSVVASAVGSIATVLSAVMGAASLMWAALTSPMAWVVAGVAAMGAKFVAVALKSSGAFRSFFKGLPDAWALVKQALGSGMDLLAAIWSGDTQKMNNAWMRFKFQATIAWDYVSQWLRRGWAELRERWGGLVQSITGAWGRTTSDIKSKWGASVEWVVSKWKLVEDALKDGAIGEAVVAHGKNIATIGVALGAVAGAFRLVGGLATMVTGVVGLIFSPVTLAIAAIAGIAYVLSDQIPGFREAVAKMFGSFGPAWDETWKALEAGWKLMKAVFSGNADETSKAWKEFTKQCDKAWGLTSAQLQKSWADMKKQWKETVDYIGPLWNDAWDGIVKDTDKYAKALLITFTTIAAVVAAPFRAVLHVLEKIGEARRALFGKPGMNQALGWSRMKPVASLGNVEAPEPPMSIDQQLASARSRSDVFTDAAAVNQWFWKDWPGTEGSLPWQSGPPAIAAPSIPSASSLMRQVAFGAVGGAVAGPVGAVGASAAAGADPRSLAVQQQMADILTKIHTSVTGLSLKYK